MEVDRTQNIKAKKNKIERIAKIKYEKFKRIVEHKMNLHNSIVRISQIAAIPVLMSFTTDNAKIEKYNEDKNPNKFPTENTIGTTNSEISSIINDLLQKRQEKFLQELFAKTSENITKIKQSEKKGIKRQTLRETFGKSVNTRYYCTFGALSTINQVIESYGFHEFKFLNEYIENPHACLSVISGLKNKDKDLLNEIDEYIKNNAKKLNGVSLVKNIRSKLAKNPPSDVIDNILEDVKIKLSSENDDIEETKILKTIANNLEKAPIVVETNNIKKEIAYQMEKNPNSVLIVVHNSTGNHTASGKHAGLVMKKINPQTSEKGTTIFAGYNGEQIKNVDEYFQKTKNVGFVYNITEKAAQELKKSNYANLNLEQETNSDNNLLAWAEVSSVKDLNDEFDAKSLIMARTRNKTY